MYQSVYTNLLLRMVTRFATRSHSARAAPAVKRPRTVMTGAIWMRGKNANPRGNTANIGRAGRTPSKNYQLVRRRRAAFAVASKLISARQPQPPLKGTVLSFRQREEPPREVEQRRINTAVDSSARGPPNTSRAGHDRVVWMLEWRSQPKVKWNSRMNRQGHLNRSEKDTTALPAGPNIVCSLL